MPRPLGPLPRILEQPVIPLPLHGVNPRSIMGRPAWDKVRREVYARHDYRCAVCGVPSREALFKPWLEAHERFEIDWRARTMTLIGMEPLCKACHSCCHTGLMEVNLAARRITRKDARTMLEHGTDVLRQIEGVVPQNAHRLCLALGIRHGLKVAKSPPAAGWSGWKMIWDGKEYPSPYGTEADWRRAMKKQNTNF